MADIAYEAEYKSQMTYYAFYVRAWEYQANYNEEIRYHACYQNNITYGAEYDNILVYEGEYDMPAPSGEGTKDYNLLYNKPQINNVTLIGNKMLPEIGIDTISYLDIANLFN
jgi:hypothetical protein